MVEFETLEMEELKFGENGFIEVARKKAISEDGENKFISIARGFMTDEDSKRYTKNFSMPVNRELAEFVSEKLPEVVEED